jgi:hypothetical protein
MPSVPSVASSARSSPASRPSTCSPDATGRLAGSCYLFLQDAKAAVATLERTARELQEQSKAQAVVLGNLAIAHIRQGSRDAAIARLHEDRHHRAEPGRGGLNVIFGAGRGLRRWRAAPKSSPVKWPLTSGFWSGRPGFEPATP